MTTTPKGVPITTDLNNVFVGKYDVVNETWAMCENTGLLITGNDLSESGKSLEDLLKHWKDVHEEAAKGEQEEIKAMVELVASDFPADALKEFGRKSSPKELFTQDLYPYFQENADEWDTTAFGDTWLSCVQKYMAKYNGLENNKRSDFLDRIRKLTTVDKKIEEFIAIMKE